MNHVTRLNISIYIRLLTFLDMYLVIFDDFYLFININYLHNFFDLIVYEKKDKETLKIHRFLVEKENPTRITS